MVELAAVAALHAPLLTRQIEQISETGVEQYWIASKSRLDRWSRALKRYATRIEAAVGLRRVDEWRSVRPVVEEIFLGEVLCRVWTAISAAYDRHRGTCEIEPLARSVLVGQSEARNRALNLIVYGQGFGLEEAVDLNRLRRRTERWTDLLLGCCAGATELPELAFELDRASEFATEFRAGTNRPDHRPACQLALASLRCAFHQGPYASSPNCDLNAKIAAALLSCFPGDVFDSTGHLKSLWLLRLEAKTNDTQGLVDELLAIETPLARSALPRTRRADGPHVRREPRF